VLHIPGGRSSEHSTGASLDPTELARDHVQSELMEKGLDRSDVDSYRKINTQVVPLDTLRLSPDLIKLDVEGFELQALQGLQETLTKHLSALLIEANHPHRWLPLVVSLGYETYCFNQATRSLNSFKGFDGIINLFCLHTDSKKYQKINRSSLEMNAIESMLLEGSSNFLIGNRLPKV